MNMWKLMAWWTVVVLLCGTAAWARVSVPAVFSDHMVVQEGAESPVWGKADPGEEVIVSIGNQTKTTKADAAGQWKVKLDKLPVGPAGSLTIKGKNTLVINDVLAGEVWLCAGQSNMKMMVSQVKTAKEIASLADSSGMIRVCWAGGHWSIVTAENLANICATPYFYGRELRRALDVPVGLIVAASNGSPIEGWTSLDVQKDRKELQPVLEKWYAKQAAYNPEAEKAAYEKKLAEHRQAAAQAKAQGKPIPRAPLMPVAPNKMGWYPGNLFNAMIVPVIPYAIHGAIWYQGESNSQTPEFGRLYAAQLACLVTDWRSRWGQGDFPFIWVQLPNFNAVRNNCGAGWPEVRESMLKSLILPNTGMAIAIDIGETNVLHPVNKPEVGRRLALWALANLYGKNVPFSGPLPAGQKIESGQIICSFKHTDGGLKTRDGGEIKGFMIAGADRKWVKANAKIVGDQVVVSSPEVKDPVAVRYAWADDPKCNLVNGADLPASPFRSDNWE